MPRLPPVTTVTGRDETMVLLSGTGGLSLRSRMTTIMKITEIVLIGQRTTADAGGSRPARRVTAGACRWSGAGPGTGVVPGARRGRLPSVGA